jgi:hypothetical protein
MILARSNLVNLGGPIVMAILSFFSLPAFVVFFPVFFLDMTLPFLEVTNYHQTPDNQHLRKKRANKSY